jgi:hypothetical protein
LLKITNYQLIDNFIFNEQMTQAYPYLSNDRFINFKTNQNTFDAYLSNSMTFQGTQDSNYS